MKQPSRSLTSQIESIIKNSASNLLSLLTGRNLITIERIAEELINALRAGHKILFCGNGGSAADSQHLAAEFVGRFQKERIGLAAISLTTDTSVLTSIGNDYGFDAVFSRQLEALAGKGDIVVILSTSGKSANVVQAAKKAKELGVKVVALTGRTAGPLGKAADVSLIAPGETTARIQEVHILLGHILAETVENALYEPKRGGLKKIKTLKDLLPIVRRLKKTGKRIVFTNGCFDLLHSGHLKLLREAKSQGDILIVGLNSDASVKKIKGPGRPLISEKERVEMLADLQPVDYIVTFEEEAPDNLISRILPHVLVKGADYDKNQVRGRSIVEKSGGKVVLVPLLPNCSTSGLLSKIRDGDSP